MALRGPYATHLRAALDPAAAPELAGELRAAGWTLEADLLEHGAPAHERVHVGAQPPSDAHPGDRWLDTLDLALMTLEGETWIAARPVENWQVAGFVDSADLIELEPAESFGEVVSHPTRVLDAPEHEPASGLSEREGALYLAWLGKTRAPGDGLRSALDARAGLAADPELWPANERGLYVRLRYVRDRLAPLLAVLAQVRAVVESPANDFAWSSWRDHEHALAEIDAAIAGVRDGSTGDWSVAVLFAPTGPLQELAVSSGWGDEFLRLATAYELALQDRAQRAAHFACAVCARTAGVVRYVERPDGAWLHRDSFSSRLTQHLQPEHREAIRAALDARSAKALYASDFEHAPFYCPDCDASYCGDHWVTHDVWDSEIPDLYDSLRGRCPRGHEHTLED